MKGKNKSRCEIQGCLFRARWMMEVTQGQGPAFERLCNRHKEEEQAKLRSLGEVPPSVSFRRLHR